MPKSINTLQQHVMQVFSAGRMYTTLLQVLREDVEAALAEASLAQERAALLGLEQDELQQQRDQLAGAACDAA
jgi:hypothetical protein